MAKARTTYGVKPVGARYQARPYVPGRGKLYAGTWDTHEEATEAAIRKIEEERRLPASKETVASFAKRWIKDFPRPKESTNDRYRADAKRFAEHVGSSVKLHEITVPEARSYARAHPHDLGGLRAMFSDARRDGLVIENPFSELGITRGPGRSEIVAITAEELDMLAEIALQEHGPRFGPRFRAIIIFAAETTLRPGEIFGLDRPDVDIAREMAHIRRQYHKRRIQLPKNGKPRKLPYLPPNAARAISEMPRLVPPPICPKTGGEVLFPGKLGQRIAQSALWSYWGPVRATFEASLSPERRAEFRAARNPDKPTMDFYELRHYGATQMVEKGVESWIIAKMMGHEDGGRLVEKTYGHPRDEVARERLRQVFQQNVKPLRAVDGEAEEATG